MSFLFGSSGSRKGEINLLRNENKLLKKAVSPLTSIGIPVENIAELLQPLARMLKDEIEKEKTRASSAYHSSGASASSSIGVKNQW